MSLKKPNQIMPSSSTSKPSPMPQFIQDPSIRGASFDQLLNNRGIRFIHERATPCPNIRSLDDNTHDPNCEICGTKGFLYYDTREITGIFTGSSLEKVFEQQGVWEIGQAVVTFPAEYNDGTQADFNQYDKLFIPDFEVRLWELKEYEPRTDNKQQLRYSITSIDHISSVENNVLVTYTEGIDYEIDNGDIKWITGGNHPGYRNTDERGSVFTVSYFANPTFAVIQTLRELRITQEMVNGVKVARRLPQEVLIKKDYLTRPGEKIE